ncbi:PP2C family protein-serine/threonine phosphatase [Geitlerinema sp. PCC 9228]|jgi:sigma-B regulation protein RsbU (phosphoserine phosphatase)|uniref:PP2C family protein-serine/threonine phosphatase n=1 Tax=Geitlerinema sp. PCC 9228 TaxID=111611 RepID=UPI000A03A0B7|nr:PP2C family protein-serine/threonine phosphatase [Geitlerinema sp. PCC 9228]
MPSATERITPVIALKELVARLQREQHKVHDLLSSLGFALRSFNNLNQFLELIPLVASRVTDADGGALILYKPDGQVKLHQLHCHRDRNCQDVRSALEKVVHQISVGDATTQLSALSESLDTQVQSDLGEDVQLFGTPILVKRVERGRLYVFSRQEDYTWTETRQKLIRLVADQTAVAIDNDELAVKLRKKERLDRELEIGGEIQQQLLPRQFPTIAGVKLAARCKTADQVGGDYYDFIPVAPDPKDTNYPGGHPEGKWAIAIGDVMGKGVPAGLIMTMTRGMLRGEVFNGYSPSKILQHLNWAMYADLENSHRFVTLFYAEYDPKSRLLSYSNAAHNPPLLWQAREKTVQRLDTSGMLIGLAPDSQYGVDRVQLQPGDMLLYYTDGFTDAASATGDRFDEENLIEAFQTACQRDYAAQATIDHIFDCVEEFVAGGGSSQDDMTLVVMQVEPPTA